ncbi:DUF4112 domain-containing protein [Aquicoccus sp. SCR17]|nr:DUF4112 domain-containing protein [Carideicomes alvinocaridis]
MPSTSSPVTDPVRPAGGRPQAAPPLSDREAELARLEALAHRMDTLFRLPVVGIRVGLDSILGLIPGIGDTATALPAAYIIYRAHKLGAPPHLLARMGANAGVDWVLGSIPLIGDLFDLGFKANRRNVAMLRRHFDRQG